MKKVIFLAIALFTVLCAVEARVTGVRSTYTCEGGMEIKYNLSTATTADISVFYSTDNGRTYLPCKTLSGDTATQSAGTNKLIIWDVQADGYPKGYIKVKVEAKEPDCVMIGGVCWATRNVDAPGTFAAKPEDSGIFYQWNSNIGWSATDPAVSTDGSAWNSAWNGNNASTWETTNNVCPTGFRVPTQVELKSLADAGSVWTTQNGVNGRLFGSGDNTLFLPAAGYRYYNSGALNQTGSNGFYWSSTPVGSTSYNLYFNSGLVNSGFSTYWAHGCSVRCVAE